jgi:hypothetical protein
MKTFAVFVSFVAFSNALFVAPSLAHVAAATVARLVAPVYAQAPRDIPAQAQAGGTGIIRGRVTRADTGGPLRGATVSLNAVGVRNLPTATTDEEGRFELAGLPAAHYTLLAGRSGYVTLRYGQLRPHGSSRVLGVEDGQALEGVDVALPRAGAIGGRLVDEAGEPVAGAFVQVLRQRYVRGVRQLVTTQGIMDRTDDLGEFRIHGLAPGNYVLSASVARRTTPAESQILFTSLGDAVSYYPGTPSAAAALAINVGLGQDVSGLSMTMAAPRLAAISGTVRMADGSDAKATSVRLAQVPPFSPGGTSSSGVAVRPDGSFSIPNLAPGAYTVEASPGTRSELVASAHVILDGTDVSVPLVIRRGVAVRGHVTFEGGPAPARAAGLGLIGFEAADPAQVPSGGASVVNDDWTFEVRGLSAVRRFRVRPPDGWWLRDIRLGDNDITDATFDFSGPDLEGVEIRLTNRPSEVRGLVRDAAGRPTGDAAIVLLAEDSSKWTASDRYVVVTQPDQAGRFAHRGLPPGRYIAAAVDFLEDGEETNPEMLEKLRGAGSSVVLTPGETTPLDLVVRPAP